MFVARIVIQYGRRVQQVVSATDARYTKRMEFLQAFDVKTLERAFGYARGGNVLYLSGSPHTVLLAEVSNGRGEVYQQRIRIKGPEVVDGDCTCPVGFNCKHVAAALIAWSKKRVEPAPQPAGLPQDVRTWLARASEVTLEDGLRRDARPADYPAKVKDRLLYVLEPDHQGLRVSIWKGRINAAGTELNTRMQRYDVLRNLRSSVPQFVRPADLDIVSELADAGLIAGQYSYGGYSDIPEPLQLQPRADARLIERICATGRCFSTNDVSQPLRWCADPKGPELAWHAAEDGHQKLAFAAGKVCHIGRDVIWIDADAGQTGRFDRAIPEDVIWLVRQSPEVAPRDLSAVSLALPRDLASLSVPRPVSVQEVTRKAKRRVARLALDVARTSAHSWYREPALTLPTLTLRFAYDGTEIAYDDFDAPRFMDGHEAVTIERDSDWEDACWRRLEDAGAMRPLEADFTPTNRMLEADLVFPETPSRDAMRFSFQLLPQLRDEGWEITQSPKWPYKLTEGAAEFSVTTQSELGDAFQGHDWFSLGFQAMIGKHKLDIAPLIAAFLDQAGGVYDLANLPGLDAFTRDLDARPIYAPLGKADYAEVSLAPIAPVLHLFLRRQAEMSAMHPTEAPVASEVRDALAGSDVRFSDHAGIIPLAEAFRALNRETDFVAPKDLAADLRPYQAMGASWMQRLTDAGFGGVLADDMGLGKTLQALTVLLARKGQGTSLLVVPTSLLPSWQEQAAQFVPGLKLLTLHGLKRRHLMDQIPDADLVLTTYPLLSRDLSALSAQKWDLIIVDEAQVLKNPASQTAKALRELSGNGRLALTGTPVENSLQDLWTLFDWVVPGLLGNRKTFNNVFRKPIEKQGDDAAQARLNRRLRPFLLRRTKEEVASELPPRTEIVVSVDLTKPQQALYETVRAAMDERVRDAVSARGLSGAQITILDALLKLRQVCCDPQLVKSEAAQGVTESAKRARLNELLRELVAEGRRVLVFSQFTTMLDLIATDLRAAGIGFEMLTGQTKDRAEVLNAFRQGDASVFLLSLKAGGVGLTLTEADKVILYDPWWNPAVERQAMDRAHRIGQDKPVFVHRLVARGTVEEKILSLQARKQALADALLSNPDTPTEGLFDEATLRDLFAPLA